MTLEELLKLKQEDYQLFIKTTQGLNEEIPKYKTMSSFAMKSVEVQCDPDVKAKISTSLLKVMKTESYKSKMSEAMSKDSFKELRSKAGKAKANMKYAIYEGKEYTRTELSELLGVSKTVIWSMKTGYTINRFNLIFL